MFGRRPTTVQSDYAERRDSPRHDTNLPARIIIPGGKSVRCCIVNISNSGALLMAPGVAGLPEQFALQDNTGRARRVQVVRKEISRVAVRFLAAA
jgi:hypothetical protein